MESNGKGTDRSGRPITYRTSPVVWGDEGTNGQHAFFQALHQGTHLIPCDFIGFINPLHSDPRPHQQLLANMIAQAESLAMGRAMDKSGEVNAREFRNFPGNRPSNMVLVEKLTPLTLGKLIALYEHKVVCQGFIWNIHPFDQWGVELGKQTASQIDSNLQQENEENMASHDSSTRRLIRVIGEKTKLPAEPES
jgi:glucose-6-phosphate isomerase